MPAPAAPVPRPVGAPTAVRPLRLAEPPPASAAPTELLAEVEALHRQLRDAAQRVQRLVQAVKLDQRQRKVVEQALRSLRHLRASG
jgi:hypothetical protein